MRRGFIPHIYTTQGVYDYTRTYYYLGASTNPEYRNIQGF